MNEHYTIYGYIFMSVMLVVKVNDKWMMREMSMQPDSSSFMIVKAISPGFGWFGRQNKTFKVITWRVQHIFLHFIDQMVNQK